MGNLVAHDVVASLIYLCFIYTLFFFINIKDVCVNVMYENAQVLDEELNLRWSGFLVMIFYILLAFHINLINTKCCIFIIFFYN